MSLRQKLESLIVIGLKFVVSTGTRIPSQMRVKVTNVIDCPYKFA
jgi:hypothetical protein